MKLMTFSALLQFAVDREKDFLGGLLNLRVSAPHESPQLIERLKSMSEKNVKSFQTIMRENITELVMEPYDTIDGGCFLCPIPGTPARKDLHAALKRHNEFLREASRVITMKEVKRALDKIILKNDESLKEL